MLSPLELLDLAQKMAARLPSTQEYAEERDAAWLAVGTARLRFGDIANAQWALESLYDVGVQARLRIEIGNWVGEHPESETGRTILKETVAQIAALENYLSRKSLTDLVPALFRVLGADAVRSMAQQLQDPFTASNVYVQLSFCLADTAAKREVLQRAEQLASGTQPGNRDYALRWVLRGYERAGLTGDAERILHLASRDLEEMTQDESVLMAKASMLLPQTPHDMPPDRLRRFLDYKLNDLKVVFLVDACQAGGVADPEMERLLRSEEFQRIEAPRTPRIGSDTSALDPPGMARFLFGRPVCRHEADRLLLTGEDSSDAGPDEATFVRQLCALFTDFGRLAAPYSEEQVEQGLWFVIGHPFWLGEMLRAPLLPSELREECLRSMVHPFRDYYLPRDGRWPGSAFFMWWDSLAYCDEGRLEIQAVLLEVIEQVLQLPGKDCQFAALHGLNHMHAYPPASALAREFLEQHRSSLSKDDLRWVESCAEGRAL